MMPPCPQDRVPGCGSTQKPIGVEQPRTSPLPYILLPQLPHEHPGALCFVSVDGRSGRLSSYPHIRSPTPTAISSPTRARSSKEATHRSVGQQWLLHHWQIMKCVHISDNHRVSETVHRST